jgi:hypothetical protein
MGSGQDEDGESGRLFLPLLTLTVAAVGLSSEGTSVHRPVARAFDAGVLAQVPARWMTFAGT